MKNATFVKLDDRITVNPDHITSMELTPAMKGFDEESNRAYNHPHKLVIILNEQIPESFDRYDGASLGVATRNRQLYYSGDMALTIWNYFQSQSTKIDHNSQAGQQPACSKEILEILTDADNVLAEMLDISGVDLPAVIFNDICRTLPRIREILKAKMSKVDETHPAMIAMKKRLTDDEILESKKEGEK